MKEKGNFKEKNDINNFKVCMILFFFFGEGSGTLLQYSCLENPMDRGAWWAAVHGVAQSRTRLKQLSSSSMILFYEIMLLFIQQEI